MAIMCFSLEAKILQAYEKVFIAGVRVKRYFRYPKLDAFLGAWKANDRILSSRKSFLDPTRNSFVTTSHFQVLLENEFFAFSSDILLSFLIVWSTQLNCQIFYICSLQYNIRDQSDDQISTSYGIFVLVSLERDLLG